MLQECLVLACNGMDSFQGKGLLILVLPLMELCVREIHMGLVDRVYEKWHDSLEVGSR